MLASKKLPLLDYVRIARHSGTKKITQAAVASILNPGRNAYIGLNDRVNEVSFQE